MIQCLITQKIHVESSHRFKLQHSEGKYKIRFQTRNQYLKTNVDRRTCSSYSSYFELWGFEDTCLKAEVHFKTNTQISIVSTI